MIMRMVMIIIIIMIKLMIMITMISWWWSTWLLLFPDRLQKSDPAPLDTSIINDDDDAMLMMMDYYHMMGTNAYFTYKGLRGLWLLDPNVDFVLWRTYSEIQAFTLLTQKCLNGPTDRGPIFPFWWFGSKDLRRIGKGGNWKNFPSLPNCQSKESNLLICLVSQMHPAPILHSEKVKQRPSKNIFVKFRVWGVALGNG